MKATLLFNTEGTDKILFDDSKSEAWNKKQASPHSQIKLNEALKQFSDIRQAIDYLIKTYKVKVIDAVPPKPLPEGAVN